MDEATFSNRLRYVAFKRMIVVMEVMVFVVLLGVIVHYQVPPPWFEVMIFAQLSRIAAEVVNHVKLQTLFNVRDNWLFFPVI